MKYDSPLLDDANINIARRLSNHQALTVRSIRACGGCGADATVMVNGYYPRCQQCSNKVVSAWNVMRLNKSGDDSA